MYEAKLTEDFICDDGTIIPAGTLISAKYANHLYRTTNKRGQFACTDCNVEVCCVKQASDLDNMKPNEKNPYFKEKGGTEKHHEACAFKNRVDSSENKDKYKIKTEVHYYSKLTKPYQNQSEMNIVN